MGREIGYSLQDGKAESTLFLLWNKRKVLNWKLEGGGQWFGYQEEIVVQEEIVSQNMDSP